MIRPALTPEEWADRVDAPLGGPDTDGEGYILDGDLMVTYDSACAAVPVVRRHALAALALHGQPFGFTREDVELLRGSQLWADSTRLVVGGQDADFDSLAARIEALLPPLAPPVDPPGD